MRTTIRLGTRPSLLALRQAEEMQALLPEFHFATVPIETRGDKDKTTPLSLREKSDFFTFEIEEALRRGEIDAAVHSAKDMEDEVPEDVPVVAVTYSISPFDSLVSRDGRRLEELAAGSRVGTSSRNRRDAIRRYRGDLVAKEIRGNVDQRLAQLDRGDFEAIIVAHAALLRLGLKERAAQIIPSSIIQPHPLQGRLAVQIHKERKELAAAFRRIDASESR